MKTNWKLVKTILDQSHLTPFPLQVAPTYWSYDHTLRLYPLPTAVLLCDPSGWGSFKVTYEGCCVINTGSLLRVDQGDGRGRYTAAWWEWDCGLREGNEIVIGITERQNKDTAAMAKETKERKRKIVEKNVREDIGVKGPSLGNDDRRSRVVLETQVEESQIEGQNETQMDDIDYEEEMAIDE